MQEHSFGAVKVGIISPYRQQILLIKQLLRDHDFRRTFIVEVNTIDGFQASTEILSI